jgi:aspartyl-tRNA(Asn)/glutamyl-tRNA(Gln) amidotransferase subunit B
LIELDDGARLEYYQDVVDILQSLHPDQEPQTHAALTRMAGNWVLHELGGLLTKADRAWDDTIVPARALADLVDHLQQKRITGSIAKQVLAAVFDGDRRPVPQLLEEDNLLLRPMSREEYVALAETVLAQRPEMVEQIRSKGQLGKMGWFLGQMMRLGEKGRVEAPKAQEVLQELILGKQ